ncbi:MAG: DNA repair protein RadC [Candidatus Eisenbacteria bacterium]|nr:DNA repair protein RadC [Candidatus Eisenbacteria bacterium]
MSLRGPDAAAAVLARYIGFKDREHFAVLHLDSRHRIRGVEIVAIGTLSAAMVHPREIFKGAILSNAASLICGHNHPSGDPLPSDDDRTIHEKLRKAGELLDIEVLDHIVLGDGSYYSVQSEQWAPIPEWPPQSS